MVIDEILEDLYFRIVVDGCIVITYHVLCHLGDVLWAEDVVQGIIHDFGLYFGLPQRLHSAAVVLYRVTTSVVMVDLSRP